MKKTVIMLIGLMMLMSVSSFATQTRTMVMGDNHMVLVDDYNMFMFPGRVNNYPNLAQGEFSASDDFDQFGVTFQFNDDNPWVLGMFISEDPEFGPHDFWGNNMADFDEASDDDERRIQLLYGRQLGGHNFGFGLDVVRYTDMRESDSASDVPGDWDESFSQYSFTFGLTEGTSGQWDVALRFMTGSWTAEYADGDVWTEPDGFSDFGLAARYFWVRNPKVTLVPHAGIMIGKRGVEYHNDPDDADDNTGYNQSATAFELGMGMNYTPAPNILAVFDIGFRHMKVKEDGGPMDDQVEVENFKDTEFPYYHIGFEGEVFSWMDVRCGATGSLWSNKSSEEDIIDGQKWDWDYNSVDTYFGFGFNWGRLYLDTYTDPELLLNGPDFISGAGSYDGTDMNWQVSLTYEMF